MCSASKIISLIAAILLIIGGLNWGLIALANVDVVASIFGAGTPLARIVYGLIGLSAIWSIFQFKCVKDCCCSSSCKDPSYKDKDLSYKDRGSSYKDKDS